MSWRETTVGEFVNIKHGFAFKGDQFNDHGPFVVLTPGNCHNSGGFKDKGEKEKRYSGDVPDGYLLNKGDLLVVMTDLVGTAPVLGGSFIIPEDNRYLHNQRLGLVTVKADAEADPLFLYHLFNTENYRGQVRGSASGATVRHTSPGRISACKVRVPDLPTQQRIAGMLSAYDDLIENNRRRILLLEQAARLLYREWFLHLRFPGHESAKIVDGLPEGWERVTLQSVCSRITDGSHSSPQSVDDGFPMASVKDMHNWGIVTKTCRLIGREDFESLVKADCKPRVNDVLIAKDGSYLKHCFAVQKEMDMVILSSIAILRPSDRIDPHYLALMLSDPQVKERMKGYVSGAALPRIILREFRNFEIVLPSADAQGQWAVQVHPLVRQCFRLIEQNESLTRARDLLLPRLMDGRIPV